MENRIHTDNLVPIELFAPPEFWKLTKEEREKLTNGCGPGGWRIDLIPDSIDGLPIHTCCDIHDFMYGRGKSVQDKEEADRVFLNNILRMIDAAPDKSFTTDQKRRIGAFTYYNAVATFGGPAFWKGKNKPEELNTVIHFFK